MNSTLSSVTKYLTSLWRSEPVADHVTFKQSDTFSLSIAQLATRALNQQISDNMPGCTFGKATLRETKNGKLSFHAESGEIIIFSNEKTMNEYLAEKAKVDIWEIQDLRGDKSRVFYKLQRADAWGYDSFETRDKLFDQLREDYGVFWKLEDPESLQTTYIRYKTGLLGSYYDHVAHENLIYVADSLGFGAPNQATPATSDRASWGPGKTIAACLLGGLLISAGRSWESNQNSVSDAIAMMKGTLGPVAFKTAFVFQMSTIAAMSRQQSGALPGALLAGMMFLPESVMGQTLCPQLRGSHDTPDIAYDVAISGNYAYVADYASGLQLIDVSNVANPTLAGSYNTPGTAQGIAVSGNYAYVADGNWGLRIIDVSNKTNPTLAGSYNTPDAAYGVTVSGNYAYVADFTSNLQIIDVSNVANPTLAGSYNTPGFAYDVAVSGNYAYVADGSSGLQIIDVSNVTNPALAGSYNTPDAAYGVAISGNYAYVADRAGLQIIDVSNVANPTLAGSYDTPGSAWGVAVSDNYAFVADNTFGLQIIDLACPTSSTSSTSFTSTTSSSTTTSSTTSSGSSSTSSSTTTSTSSSSSTTSSSSTSSTSSRNPTTTTSSTIIPTDESSTSSSSSIRSTNPLGSTTNNPSSTLSLSEYSTLKSTMLGDSTTTGFDGTPLIWLGLLAGGFAGGALCICLVGETVVILRRKFRNEESISVTGSSDVEMPERQEENGEGETYTRLSDVVSAQNMKNNHSSNYAEGQRRLDESKNPKPYEDIEEAARFWQD